MFKKNHNLKENAPFVISPADAQKMYKDGARTFRKPDPRVAGNGLDTNSFDFRGVRAAMNVVKTFPRQTDAENSHVAPLIPQEVKAHMDLGLTAIQDAGRRPLSGEFIEGYSRMAEAFARPEQPISALGQEATQPK